MTRSLRLIAEPFVVAPPAGARVRARLWVDEADVVVLKAVGEHLGSLASADLAVRCAQGRLDAKAKAVSRRARKQAMTAECSSRWAGAVTRTSEDAWQLAERNLRAERASVSGRVKKIRRRLAVGVGERRGQTRGYASQSERWEKQRRLQVLQARLDQVEARLEAGKMSICRGGRRLAKARHNLDVAGLDEAGWHQRWKAERWFTCADGEADKAWGNETIRWHPDEGWLEVRLPSALAHLANRAHGRWRLSQPVSFPYRGDEVTAEAASGAVRYDIGYNAEKDRWYLDASWTHQVSAPPKLDELRRHRVVAVDLNHGHLAAAVIDTSGNPVGEPFTVNRDMAGLPAATRDGRLRRAITDLVRQAKEHGCRAVVVEDLDFAEARSEGRE